VEESEIERHQLEDKNRWTKSIVIDLMEIQAGFRRLFIATARVRSQIRSCGIFDGQSGTGVDLFLSASVSPPCSHFVYCSILLSHMRLVQLSLRWPSNQMDSVSSSSIDLKEEYKNGMGECDMH
jgi:hypothetical protein